MPFPRVTVRRLPDSTVHVTGSKHTFSSAFNVLSATAGVTVTRRGNKKNRSEETQALRAGCSKAEPKIFAPPQTPFPPH